MKLKVPRKTKRPKCPGCKLNLDIHNFFMPCAHEDYSIGFCEGCDAELYVASYTGYKDMEPRFRVMDNSKEYYE